MAENNKYKQMLSIPALFSEEMELLDTNRARIKSDFDNEIRIIQGDAEKAEATAVSVLGSRKNEAEARFNSWQNKISQYTNTSKSTSRAVASILDKATTTTVYTVDRAIELLNTETANRALKRKKNDNDQIIQYCNKEKMLVNNIQELTGQLINAAKNQKNAEISEAESSYKAEHNRILARRKRNNNRSERKYQLRIEQEETAFSESVENLLSPDKVKNDFSKMMMEKPNYEVFEPADSFPEGIQFGYAGYDVTGHIADDLKKAVISRRFKFTVQEHNGRQYMVFPYGFAFKDMEFSTMLEFNSQNREKAAETIRNLALNMFMSIPVNKCWCTFIDPVSLGNTFAVFSPMADKDENGNGDERAIDTRIWSDEKQIEERLKLIVDHTTDVIQRCLQGKYDNILDYNEDAGINAEPLRFLMIMDFPNHFTAKSLKYLESIIDNGPQTGVYTIIAADIAEMDRAGEGSDVDRIRNHIKNRIYTQGSLMYVKETTKEGNMRYFPIESPDINQAIEIVSEIRKHLGEEIVITYPMISNDLPARQDYWFHKSAIDGISVPIGMEGAGKIVSLEFGHPYHSFAAMIGGTVGAGKSSLMHTIIQSVIFNYSPEDVQMYLLDFKQGVEFKCYADYKLPNFRVISVETEPEFGLAVLQELHEESVRRSSKFRSVGVNTIEGYWKYRGQRGESHADMPRILVIFDEIQMLMFDADNEISKKCVALIKEIVTQAVRAFGIHIILSTQTFENVKGLDSGVYGNIHTRIALKTTKASAELLLNNDNEIINRLSSMDVGQGVINNNAGDRDANRTFRAALIRDEERDNWMEQVREKQLEMMTEELEKPRILLSGPEDDSDNPLTMFESNGEKPYSTGDPAYHLYIGESLTMYNTFLPSLSNMRGQNLLIAGKDIDGTGLPRMVVGYSILSLLMETIRIQGEITAPFITVFDLSGNSQYGSKDYDMLDVIEEFVPEAFRIVHKTMILDAIDTLYSELHSGRQQFVIFYGINRAKQLTTGTYQRSPKERLEELFIHGPENGMNFIVWANDPELFVENYGAAMNSFNLRLAFGMDDKEYKAITGETSHGPISKMNMISYNLYDDNQKIRMYARATETWMQEFLMNVRKYIRNDN